MPWKPVAWAMSTGGPSPPRSQAATSRPSEDRNAGTAEDATEPLPDVEPLLFGLFLAHRLAAQQPGDLGRVVDGVVAVAVVHEDVDLLGRARQLLDAGEPLLELRRLVAVPEPVRRAGHVGRPRLGVAAVEADDGQIGGHGDHRRQGRVEALRLVDADVREVLSLQELEGPVGLVVGRPGAVAELDAEAA